MVSGYQILEHLGQGGMGRVYRARHPRLDQDVALKVLRPGFDSAQLIARFEAERQALALMDHPHIARVSDGGVTEDGQPYFVMELVRGTAITRYCEDQGLNLRRRLELFLLVCQAVQHAHQKGMIHRDLKPSNVLVTEYDGKPVPKVIDFGIAKAVAGRSAADTEIGMLVGTPEYMSPEQASLSARDMDTRSDIYALGVLLYELLTGDTPLARQRVRALPVLEVLRLIREEDPPAPSLALSALQVPTPAKQVRGELDWIVLKSLDKDRARRYQTAAALGDDVRRFLHDELVLACPPSKAYRLRKFARRNKGTLAAVAVLGLALLLAVSGIGWAVRDRSARREEAQRAHALRQARVAGQVQLILDEVARFQREQNWPEALDTARRAADLLTGSELEAEVAGQVQDTLRLLELVRLLEDIRADRREWKESGFDDRGTAERYAAAFRDAGIDLVRLTPEEASVRLRSRSAVLAALIPALSDWALWRHRTGDERGAQSVLKVVELVDPDPWRQKVRQALRDEKALLTLAAAPDLARQPAATLVSLGGTLSKMGRVDAALGVLVLARRQYPSDFWAHLVMAQTLASQGPPSLEQAAGCYRTALALRPRNTPAWTNLGNVLSKQGKPDEALDCLNKAIKLDPKFAMAHVSLGNFLFGQGKADDAMVCYHRAIELAPKYAMCHLNLGNALYKQGKLDDAIACYQRAIELDAQYATAHYNLGVALMAQKKLDDASACYRKAIDVDPKYADAYHNLGTVLARQGKVDDAIACYQRASALDPQLATAHANLGLILLFRKEDYDAAVAALRKASALQPDKPETQFNLGLALRLKGDLPEAISAFREAIRLQPTSAGAHIGLARCLTNCSDLKLRNPQEALRAAQKAVELAPQSALAWQMMGWANYRVGAWQASIAALEKSMAVSPKGGDARQWFFLAMAHWQTGGKVEARRWYDRAVAWKYKHAAKDEELRRIRAEAEEVLEIKKN